MDEISVDLNLTKRKDKRSLCPEAKSQGECCGMSIHHTGSAECLHDKMEDVEAEKDLGHRHVRMG
jgi:hypothetical protein